jgi:hypothetical protein
MPAKPSPDATGHVPVSGVDLQRAIPPEPHPFQVGRARAKLDGAIAPPRDPGTARTAGVSTTGARQRGRSHQTLRRRRTVLEALAVAVLASLVLALVGGQPGLWGAQLVADATLVSYVAALIHLRNSAAHREMDAAALRGFSPRGEGIRPGVE